MHLDSKTVRKTINKAFLKEPIERGSFTVFKDALEQLLDVIDVAKEKKEHEEHFKNFLVPFFNKVGFGDYFINTNARIDMAIHTGKKGKDPVGVLIEAKRPGNSGEMITKEQINRKAMHEAVLYYLEQRIEQDNSDLKHVIITDMDNWFIFDAQEFERFFYRPSTLRKIWKEWKSNQKVSSNNDFMYTEISKYIDAQDSTITGLWLSLDKTKKLLKGEKDSKYEKKLIPIYKLFTPTQLLKEPFANDSNSLNREFYRELLYILGLEETKDGSTRFIQRVSEENRDQGSIIENTIRILDVEDHLSTLKNSLSSYGKNRNEQLFSVAMELSITWMNRILFLKLLEAQLYRYHRQDKNFKFLNFSTIDGLDELNKLFFQVLARKQKDRSADINEKFGHIPYLNSSLFDVSSLERQTTRISGLDDHADMEVYSRSVLTKQRGKTLNTLDYLFQFLEAYDFSAEGSEEIRDESKSLINASVLGLIFEKINGYKDGSFYTPGFITEYMARETLQKAVMDAFNSKYDWGCDSFDDLYNEIHRERVPLNEANEVINDLKICDPAVGSGHFLVSCLNELIAIKSRLDILCDSEGKILRQVDVTVENDELIISWGDEELFEYDVSHSWKGTKLSSRSVSSDLERVQKTLFDEKRFLIENCLFGVDINPNSVKICRLRLWIELLKRAYYTPESDFMELEVLPNIDINIKRGNSLVSRFGLDEDLKNALKGSGYTIRDYKEAVQAYKNETKRERKKELFTIIEEIKEDYSTHISENDSKYRRLLKLKYEYNQNYNVPKLIDVDQTSKLKKVEASRKKEEKQKIDHLQSKIDEIKNNVIYNDSFEWRFEFPEVLDDEGQFTGFDVVIGNPPYIRHENIKKEIKAYLSSTFSNVGSNTADMYIYFYEVGISLLKNSGTLGYITLNKWLKTNYGRGLRDKLSEVNEILIIDFFELPVFEEASTDSAIVLLSYSNERARSDYVPIKSLKEIDIPRKITESKLSIMKESDEWKFIDTDHIGLVKKIEDCETTIGDLVSNEIYLGIKTGLNKAFIINDEKKKELIGEKDEHEVIKPYLSPTLFSSIENNWDKKWIILSHNGNKEKKVDPIDLQNDYPKIFDYLSQYKPKIKERTDQGAHWSNLRDCSYIDTFSKDKIIYVYTAKNHDFLYDTEGFIVNNSCFIIPTNNKYLWSYLNSKLFKYYQGIKFVAYGNADTSGRVKLDRNKMLSVPLKVASRDTYKKFDELYEDYSSNPDKRNVLKQKIDRLVYELYGLSEKEIGIVEGIS